MDDSFTRDIRARTNEKERWQLKESLRYQNGNCCSWSILNKKAMLNNNNKNFLLHFEILEWGKCLRNIDRFVLKQYQLSRGSIQIRPAAIGNAGTWLTAFGSQWHHDLTLSSLGGRLDRSKYIMVLSRLFIHSGHNKWVLAWAVVRRHKQMGMEEAASS